MCTLVGCTLVGKLGGVGVVVGVFVAVGVMLFVACVNGGMIDFDLNDWWFVMLLRVVLLDFGVNVLTDAWDWLLV